ncbi:asparagine synthase (glutamine-hydrolyzing) [Nocardia cerradoensis]|uniref:asparagine synthase (glutamine-hydrolyzing) n=1 Tax=Nocardia cerradoensis TaxID=85688 RepID=UPI0002F4BA1F|nr:asparagine synthase (glutamine-hydrolyzing) [Nocardia cerradoensis]NKY45270.1 asparagine synthase (glutamine-hydrolyzing) [Nocardia cerradoensis]
MSAITGWLDRDRDLREHTATVRAMSDTLAHRGPDGGGIWLEQRIALGRNVLAVADLLDNGQPVVTGEAGRPIAVLTLSGEIYNTAELRHELSVRGHAFTGATDPDAEVVLHAYLEWGADAVRRLDGMFAFAVWDVRRGELLLARDRLGIEPLYYAEHPGGLLFGSEPKALLANELFRPQVDAEGLIDIFTVAMRRPGDAVYRGLREVRPGWIVRADHNGLHHHRYWQPVSAPHTDDVDTTIATLRELLTDIVERQTRTGTAAGLLSGGLDSSVITALAARARGDAKLATYSVDFAGSDTDFTPDALHVSRDAPYVRAVVDHVGTDHTEVLLDAPALLDEMGETLRARDIPGVGDLDVSLYLLFREVRRYADVVLSGEGADDIFGGYPWFAAEATASSGSFPWAAGNTDRNAMLSPELRAHLDLDAAVVDRHREAVAELAPLAGEEGPDRRIREVFHLELTRFLPFLLDRKDRMSMRTGLLVRLPFCDHRLVEYLWNVPWDLKRHGGQEKGILRAAAEPWLPPQVAKRPKSGFPFGQSPHYLAAVREATRAMLADPSAPALALLNTGALAELAEGDRWHSGTFTPPPWLPRALQLNTWLRDYRVEVRL